MLQHIKLTVMTGLLLTLSQPSNALLSTWSTHSDQAGAHMGRGVATAGDVNGDGYGDLLAGTPDFDGPEVNEGRAQLFLGTPEGPSASPAWTFEFNQAGATLGRCVAPAGDVNADGYADWLVCAYQYDNGQNNEGAVFIFHGGPGALSTTPARILESNLANALFGFSAATAGDVNGDGYDDVIVGAFGYTNGQSQEGRAYLFLGSASGVAATAAWTFEPNQSFSSFGASVSSAGDVDADGYADLIIGAERYDSDIFTNNGSAFFFKGGPAGPGAAPDNQRNGDSDNANLGRCVSLAGDINGDGWGDLIITEPNFDSINLTDMGKVIVWPGISSGAGSAFFLLYGAQLAGEQFGTWVSTAGDVDGDGLADFLIGSEESSNGQATEGIAYLFHGDALTFFDPTPVSLEADQSGALFGACAGTAGDMNGDGRSDIVVGAPNFGSSAGLAAEGGAFFFAGSPRFSASSETWSHQGQSSGEYLGSAFVAAGDVNGDGFTDMLAHSLVLGSGNQGRAQLFLGSRQGMSGTASWTASGVSTVENLGGDLGGGDVNGDGYDDIAVARVGFMTAVGRTGAVSLYFGGPAGPAGPSDQDLVNTAIQLRFGTSIEIVGDVNGDGFSDLVVSAPSTQASSPGRIFLFPGGPTGVSLTPAWQDSLPGDVGTPNIVFASRGDYNGDGFADVALRAIFPTAPVCRYRVYHGSPLGAPLRFALESADPSGVDFSSLRGAGDVNGDGFSDLMVCGLTRTVDDSTDGGVDLVYGSPTGLDPATRQPIPVTPGHQFFGRLTSTAGDLNQDGYSDVLIAAGERIDPLSGLTVNPVQVHLGGPNGLDEIPVVVHTLANFNDAPQVTDAGDVNGDGNPDYGYSSPGYGLLTSHAGLIHVVKANGGDAPDRVVRMCNASLDPLALFDRPSETDRFAVRARLRSPGGALSTRLELEVKPFRNAFDGGALDISPWQITNGSLAGQDGLFRDISMIHSGLADGTAYHWRARMTSRSPFFPGTPWFTSHGNGYAEMDLRTGGAVSGAPDLRPVRQLAVSAAAPNPFSTQTTIAFEMPRSARLRATVHDVQGRLVRRLLDDERPAGPQRIAWDGRGDGGDRQPFGLYFFVLEAGPERAVRKIVLAR